MGVKVIDADGHVIEDETLFDYLEGSYRKLDHQLSWERMFPSLDFHHTGGHTTRNPKGFGGGKPVGAREWLEFIDIAGFDCAVLYPTKGLQIGNITAAGHANIFYAVCIPPQRVARAAALVRSGVELTLAVDDVGVVGSLCARPALHTSRCPHPRPPRAPPTTASA